MIYILDTKVISAVRRPDRAPRVARWLAGKPEADLFLSVVTLGEIARGIALEAPRNPGFAGDLAQWLERTMTLFADRILPFDADAARIWGGLSARIGHPGADLMIAATALSRDAVIVTGNVADFAPTGVQIADPFAGI